jgi:hypothetical protein
MTAVFEHRLDLASFYRIHGLTYVATHITERAHGVVELDDPDDRAAELKAEFFRATALQKFIVARRELAISLTIAKSARDLLCTPERLDAALAADHARWMATRAPHRGGTSVTSPTGSPSGEDTDRFEPH